MMDLSDFIYNLLVKLNNSGYNAIQAELILAASAVMQTYDQDELIKSFIDKSVLLWDHINTRNEAFMNKNAFSIFTAVPTEHISSFQEIFTSVGDNGNPIVDGEDRNTIWIFMESFVKISIKYIHDWQQPYVLDGKSRYRRRYPLPDGVSLHEHSKKWNIKLAFHS
jgi:hypothetical protein